MKTKKLSTEPDRKNGFGLYFICRKGSVAWLDTSIRPALCWTAMSYATPFILKDEAKRYIKENKLKDVYIEDATDLIMKDIVHHRNCKLITPVLETK